MKTVVSFVGPGGLATPTTSRLWSVQRGHPGHGRSVRTELDYSDILAA